LTKNEAPKILGELRKVFIELAALTYTISEEAKGMIKVVERLQENGESIDAEKASDMLELLQTGLILFKERH